MPLDLHDVHFAEFRRSAEAGLPWLGHTASTWARPLAEGIDGIKLPASPQDRDELRAYCQEPSHSDDACFIACMAWGRMRRDHFRTAWAAHDRLMPRIRALRTGGLSRESAYHLFQADPIPGLGPAYYTKLLFFLRDSADGYIMDQWTGKSVSLVVTPMFIKIRGKWVTSANTAAVYQRYCEAVELLAIVMGEPGDVIERKLFSMGQVDGRPPHAWRAYVNAQWPHRPRATTTRRRHPGS